MNGRRIASALRVLALCAERDLLVDRPKGVLVYARTLEPIEQQWLVDGLDSAAVEGDGPMQRIVGYLLGRVYQVELPRHYVDRLLAPARAS